MFEWYRQQLVHSPQKEAASTTLPYYDGIKFSVRICMSVSLRPRKGVVSTKLVQSCSKGAQRPTRLVAYCELGNDNRLGRDFK